MFIPLYDDNPTQRATPVTWTLIAACVLVFLWQQSLPNGADQAAIFALGFIPAHVFQGLQLPPELTWLPAWGTLFSSMFLHGDWLHLIGNMLYLWIFGNNVEESMGSVRFLIFYLLCGIAAALAQSLSYPASDMPMVGASGAIAGVLGAYFILHPHANVRALTWFFSSLRIVSIPAVWVLGVWFIGQILSGLATPAAGGGIAFWAHIGGFAAGVLLIPLFRHKDVSLFAPPLTRSFTSHPPTFSKTRGLGSVPLVKERNPRNSPWSE